MNGEYKQLQQERDQLAATVDRLRMQLMTLNDIAGEAMGDKSYDWHARATSATNGTYNLLRDTPEHSLARHDAELLRSFVDTVVPRIDAGGPNPIDEDLHHCEYTLYQERERIHNELSYWLEREQ